MRDQLEEAAVDLFHRQGFMATSVRQITSAVGVTPGALYNHFASKEEVLYAIIGVAHHELLADVQAAVDGAETGVERLRAFVEAYVLYYANSPQRSRVSNRDMEFLPAEAFSEVAGIRRQARRLLQDVLEQGSAEGAFALLDAGEMPAPRATAMAIMDMCVLVTEPYWLGASLGPAEVADVHIRLALRMAGASA